MASDKGTVVKKKRVDAPIAFRTKAIQPLAAVPIPTAVTTTNTPKLYIDQLPVNVQSTTLHSNIPPPIETLNTAPLSSKPLAANGGKKNLLDALREKVGAKYDIQEIKEAEGLNIEKLQVFWNKYTVELEKQLKHSAAGTFKIASLSIDSDIHFTIHVAAITAQKFVEQEKLDLKEQLHQLFNNRLIDFTILVDLGEKEDVPLHMRLNSKQKFERIAEQYPLIKELKEKLRLEIDY
jgi:DNA polymerase-3 subunit gamma/tau